MLSTQINTAEFPTRFREFERLVRSETWRKRTRQINSERKGKPFLAPYLATENRVAIALTEYSEQKAKQGTAFIPRIRSVADYEACSLIIQFLDVHRILKDHTQRQRLVRRLQGAFHHPADLRALQFEWLVAIHLTRRGFSLDFPEQNGSASFDILATMDSTPIEVECKSISPDKGRRIHRRDALEFHHLFVEMSKATMRGLVGGLLVRVIVPQRLPTAYVERKSLVERVQKTLLTGASSREDQLEVRLLDFEIKDSPFRDDNTTEEAVREFMGSRFGVRNTEVMTAYSPSRRAVILSLESTLDDKLVDAMFQSIEDASDRQLSGKAAGIVCAKLEGISADELAVLGSEQGTPTALRIAASRFLDSRLKSHLACLSFFSDGPLEQTSDGGVTRGGRTYFFDNPTSLFHSATSVAAFRQLL